MVSLSEHLQRHKRRRSSRTIAFRQMLHSMPMPPPPPPSSTAKDADTATTCSSSFGGGMDDSHSHYDFSERSNLGRSLNSFAPENSVSCFEIAEGELTALDLNMPRNDVVVQHDDDHSAIPIIEDINDRTGPLPHEQLAVTIEERLETFSNNLKYLATAVLPPIQDDVDEQFDTFVGQDWPRLPEEEEEEPHPVAEFLQARAQTFSRNWETLTSSLIGK